MELDPATYACPDAHSDLSALVLQALGGAGLEVARLSRLPRFGAGAAPGASTGTGAPPTATITAEVTFRGLTGGQSATVVISAARTGQVLASAAITPATDGTATRTLTVTGLSPAEPVTVAARGGSQQCRATLGAGSARPTVSCAP